MTGSTMDFFARQDAARRATGRLVALFALAVLGIVAAVYAVSAVLFRGFDRGDSLWNPPLLALVVLGVGGVVAVAAALKTGQLRQGGPAVATMLGGTPVGPGARDPLVQRLCNVVEEMAIASGVPVPRVYVLEREHGINAFAAGWGTADAAVAVTRGALEQLDRSQLQGVIAHEFSHVFHGDMRLNIRLMGVLFGIVCIATIGEILLRSTRHTGGRGRNQAAALALFGLALYAIGWIGVVFADLIKAAVSRQREFLADASAVCYTRDPHGIGLALARIAGIGSRIDNVRAREASHLFFADGVSRWLGTLGATHPPIEQRIERILPGFLAARRRAPSAEAAVRTLPARPDVAAAAAAPAAGVASAAITGLVGTTSQQLVERSRELIAALPLDAVGAAREPARAPALVCALLLQPNDAGQDAVLERLPPARAHEARNLAAALRDCDRTARLPLLELAMPALRTLMDAERQELHRDLDALALADGAMSTFEFALLHTVRRHVPATPRARAPARALPLSAATREVELVLSVMAWAGGADDAAAAFAQGQRSLAAAGPIQLLPRTSCGFDAIERATTRLEELSPLGKKNLLDACAAVAAADGRLAANEGELLRAFAESWDCPLPPLWSAPAVPSA